MMKRIRNLHFPIVPCFMILFACLCFFLAGCSGTYRTLPLPNTDPVVQAEKGDPPRLTPGDEIRLTLKDGRNIKGRFLGFQNQSLFISEPRIEGSAQDSFNEIQESETAPPSNRPGFPLSDIVLLEKYDPKTSGNMVIGGLILGSAVAMIYASQHTLDNWGD